MREQRIAARYGRALFMCLEDDAASEQIRQEVLRLSALMHAKNSDLRVLLLNPAFSAKEQSKVIDEMAKTLGLHQLTHNLLLLLIEKKRSALLPEIAAVFAKELDDKMGRLRARILSAKPLSEHELEDIVGALKRRYQKTIVPEVAVDESVLMGLKAEVGGQVFDATLSTMLSRFKRKLIDAPLH